MTQFVTRNASRDSVLLRIMVTFRIIDMRVVKLDEMQKSYNEPSHLRPVRSDGRVINVLSKKRSENT